MHFLSRKRRRTALNGIVIMALIAGLFPFGTMSAAEEVPPAVSASRLVFNDIQGHWAEQAIERWVDLGWTKGHEDGNFHPEQKVTRAEFIALANRMYGYMERAAIDYLDVMIDVAGGEEVAFRAMKDAGYSILELTRAMGSYGVDRPKMTNNLQALGYSHAEAFSAVNTIYPISIEEWMGIIMNAAGWL
ncbi:S-layer homology domain-containing protein [Paenibacillus piri]|uniref:S-layer homology domain-containing protein n=1 Tax=Paenibacillus piri TaxID=2547395 RepID=A0A4R5KGY3_9BACL|nr:S-layer homology domain-containing protein [Paenibacillus piri]TDF94699.1 S-layer homology domain-containing protein [Paenibacillus piri]